MSDSPTSPGFQDLQLAQPVLKALDDVGYETPSPIQAQIIPHILAGRDVLGQAQTGTGKTAAFALPLLSRLDLSGREPRVLVLVPTRELAIQVAEAFQRYAAHLKGLHVLPIYGGQGYDVQLRQLKRGVHVVVGTPGRVMDHMRRGTLKLESLDCLVLDEADEMLRMGFIDDVTWILERTPAGRQVALFSATLPKPIRQIARQHMREPEEITIRLRTVTAETIHQRYWVVNGPDKLDALTRILEAEPFEGMIVFVRTKTATAILAEKLEARGYDSAPLNGDISQSQRERTVERLKSGKLDILVATDVAARGLDVDRVSHVINFDIPYDSESYIHRIGRTGRMGRVGEAILFVAPRERRMLRAIERTTNQKIEMLSMPSAEAINDRRIERFKQRITDTLAAEDLDIFLRMVEQYQAENQAPLLEVAAALAKLVQGDRPLLLPLDPPALKTFSTRNARERRREPPKFQRGRKAFHGDADMKHFRIEVGSADGVQAGNIVGAIANEAGLDSKQIGRIEIFEFYSSVDLPADLPRPILNHLKNVWVAGRQLHIHPMAGTHKRREPARQNKYIPAAKKALTKKPGKAKVKVKK